MKKAPAICFFYCLLYILFLRNYIYAESIQTIYKNSKTSIVMIISYDENQLPISIGSGFYIDTQTIVTNYHVIENAYSAEIKNLKSENRYKIRTLFGYSKNYDLALLITDEIGIPLKVNKSKRQEIGDKIVDIGNPEGLEGTVSEGIISGIRKEKNCSLFQVTSPISHDSSGGPLFDENGLVIGVTTSTLSAGQNLNFAVPIWYLESITKINKREKERL